MISNSIDKLEWEMFRKRREISQSHADLLNEQVQKIKEPNQTLDEAGIIVDATTDEVNKTVRYRIKKNRQLVFEITLGWFEIPKKDQNVKEN